ncbi:MAG: ribonuclease PH [Armatimonadetes bacterium]|nr:ribonuclease PH [Armatimonadota bacterium]MDE2207068.1 ribonuclease PH [Armatimonadota bacterium]
MARHLVPHRIAPVGPDSGRFFKEFTAVTRPDGRKASQLRPVSLTTGFMPNAEGSCLVGMGNTQVICTASVDDKVPPFLKGMNKGWVTAEYAMLPRSTNTRSPRENRSGPGGRSVEIQRLIGRSLRAVTRMDLLGERTVVLDCDVLQADGGTRTAAITGAWVALHMAFGRMLAAGVLATMPLEAMVSAVSVGVVGGAELLDLCYLEDSSADVDMNVVLTDAGAYIEVQGTAERTPYSREQLNRLLDLAATGAAELFERQRAAVAAA